MKVGKTLSYGNGRRLDDGKTLAELGFEVKQAAFYVICFDYISFSFVNFIYLLIQIGDYMDVAIL